MKYLLFILIFEITCSNVFAAQAAEGNPEGQAYKVEKPLQTRSFGVMYEESKDTERREEIKRHANSREPWAIAEMVEVSLNDEKIKESVEWLLMALEVKHHEIFYTLKGHNPEIVKEDTSPEKKEELIREFVAHIMDSRKSS